MGVDKKTYALKRKDIFTLPRENATVLIEHGEADEVSPHDQRIIRIICVANPAELRTDILESMKEPLPLMSEEVTARELEIFKPRINSGHPK